MRVRIALPYRPDADSLGAIMSMCIITNWKPRNLVSAAELPGDIWKTDFDYVGWEDAFSPRFFSYRGAWRDSMDAQSIRFDTDRHPLGWAMHVHPGSPIGYFDAIESDTYFSGTMWKFVDDDTVIVARYYS
jgi:hypothetical protein